MVVSSIEIENGIKNQKMLNVNKSKGLLSERKLLELSRCDLTNKRRFDEGRCNIIPALLTLVPLNKNKFQAFAVT